MNMLELLRTTIERGATDLHLTKDNPPMLRLYGDLVPLDGECLSAEEVEGLIMSILSPEQKNVLRKKLSLDLAYNLDGPNGSTRFRMNVFYQRSSVAIAVRRLSDEILSFKELGLPPVVESFCDYKDGLVLVTGITGSGKTTTLASMVDKINATRACHIITVEDPIEYIHHRKKAVINQREIHSDVFDFASALRDALREDPDVILVGEMRDLETIRTAIMAAETGHLVFATLHTQDAISTIRRAMGVFPKEEQEQIRNQLSMTLRAVLSQKLLKQKDGQGRVPMTEIMVVTPGISNVIRLHKDEQIYSIIETGVDMGMQTATQSLIALFQTGKISRETALGNAKDIRSLEMALGRQGRR